MTPFIDGAMEREKEVTMRSLVTTSALVTAICVVLGASSAWAETLEVNVPFPFVVHGQTLPAGQYRLTNNGGLVQIRGEHGNGASLVIMTTPADGRDPAGDEPVLIFTRDANQYRLADIWESGTHGLAPVSR